MSSIPSIKSPSKFIGEQEGRGAKPGRGMEGRGIHGPERDKGGGFKNCVKDVAVQGKVAARGSRVESDEPMMTSMHVQPWTRPEGRSETIQERSLTPSTVNLTDAQLRRLAGCDRILVGEQSSVSEALLRLSSGPAAGMEVKISSSAIGIDASVIAVADGGRLSANAVMQEMAIRLRRKGYSIRLSDGSSQGKSKNCEENDDPKGK